MEQTKDTRIAVRVSTATKARWTEYAAANGEDMTSFIVRAVEAEISDATREEEPTPLEEAHESPQEAAQAAILAERCKWQQEQITSLTERLKAADDATTYERAAHQATREAYQRLAEQTANTATAATALLAAHSQRDGIGQRIIKALKQWGGDGER